MERVVPNTLAESTVYTPNSVNQYTTITGTLADTPTYDLNGNQLTVGRVVPNEPSVNLTLRYDEENRLIEAATATRREIYLYDGLGRRVEKQVQDFDTLLQTWTLATTARYVYDGWRVMEELALNSQLSTLDLVRSYTRGLDLSGTPEGAGGIGGLLGMTEFGGGVPSPRTASYFYDGIGNVTDLIFDDGTTAAHYEYSPFGERLVTNGIWADTNPYQFSSKERDILTGFSYFGYRYYNPVTGRWLTRDPLLNFGHIVLKGETEEDLMTLDGETDRLFDEYVFSINDSLNNYDVLGENPILVTVGGILTAAGRYFLQQYIKRKLKRIAECEGIYFAYKAAGDAADKLPCGKCKTCPEYLSHLGFRALEVGGRLRYLNRKCDYVLPGSVFSKEGSKGKEATHKGEAKNKGINFTRCAAIATAAGCIGIPQLPNAP